MKRTQAKKPSKLQFYWCEIESNVVKVVPWGQFEGSIYRLRKIRPQRDIRPNDVKGAAWGQFVGSIHRLRDIDEELTDALRKRDIRKRLHRVTRIIESYLYRAYELRERVVNLLAVVSGDAAAAKATKHPPSRAKALSKIQRSHLAFCEGVDRLMNMLQDDMDLRNEHTHGHFLSLGLMVGNGPYDPEDVLTELESQPDEYRAMTALLRKETKRLADEYRTRIRSVRDAAFALAEIADPIRSPKK